MPTIKFPMRHWMDHITFDDSLKPYAVYKLPMQNYSMLSDSEKESLFHTMHSLYSIIERDFKIMSFCREVLPETYENDMVYQREGTESFRKYRNPQNFTDDYREHVNSVKKELQAVRGWQRELFLVIPLDKSTVLQKIIKKSTSGGVKRGLMGGLSEVKNAAWEMFLGKDPVLDVGSIDKIFADESDTFDLVSNAVRGERATNSDIQWILNRISTRSIQPRRTHDKWVPSGFYEIQSDNDVVMKPIKSTLTSMFYSYEMDDSKIDYMSIKHGDTGEVSFQSFVQFSDYPEDIAMPGSEVFYAINNFGFPVDIVTEVKFMSAADASRKLYGKNLELIEQSRQYTQSVTGSPLELRDAHNRSKVLEDKFDKKQPLLFASTTLCVSATDEATLRQQRSEVINNLKGYYAVCAPSKQRESYMQFMPVMTYGLDIYSIPMDPGFLASGMMNATVDIGEKIGFYIGLVLAGNKQPLLINPPLAQANNKTATTAILGNLGGGKSVLNKTIIYFMLMWGARVIAIDPKNENYCFKQIASVIPRMRQIDVGDPHGVGINPYTIAQTPGDSIAVVVDFLSIILNANEVNQNSESRRLAIGRAVSIVMDQPAESRDMNNTLKAFFYMAYHDDTIPDNISKEAEMCYLLLQDQKVLPVGNIVFREDNNYLDINNLDYQFVNFNISKLPLPTEQDIASLGQHGRLSPTKLLGTAIMYLIVQFARYSTLTGDKRIYKVLSLDEAWRITSTQQGADLVMEIIRMGRTYNIMPVVVTQSAADLLDEKVKNNIGMVFMFKNKDENEIRNCAKLLGVKDVDNGFIEEVRALESGRCFYRDTYDRVSKVQIRCKPDHVFEIFKTDPDSSAKLEEKEKADKEARDMDELLLKKGG